MHIIKPYTYTRASARAHTHNEKNQGRRGYRTRNKTNIRHLKGEEHLDAEFIYNSNNDKQNYPSCRS